MVFGGSEHTYGTHTQTRIDFRLSGFLPEPNQTETNPSTQWHTDGVGCVTVVVVVVVELYTLSVYFLYSFATLAFVGMPVDCQCE